MYFTLRPVAGKANHYELVTNHPSFDDNVPGTSVPTGRTAYGKAAANTLLAVAREVSIKAHHDLLLQLDPAVAAQYGMTVEQLREYTDRLLTPASLS